MRRITVVEYKPNIGPEGPQGPPGPGTSFPIDSANILYVPTNQSVEEVLDGLLFVPMSITSFTTPQSVFEIGHVINSLLFTWVLSKNPASQTITGTEVTPPTLLPADRAKTVVFDALASDGTVTLTVDDGNGPVTSAINLSFAKGVYAGSAPIPGGGVNSTFINTLNKSVQAARQRTFTVNLTTGVYGWYAAPVAYGLPTFKVNGFNGGMTSAVTVSVTNGFGHTEDYYVFRTTNPSLGITEIEAL